MSLASKLQEIKAGAAKRIPEEKRQIMGRATAALGESGIMDKVIAVGDSLPPFALENRDGEEVRSADLLARGPLVVTVFRGSW